jgi:hypothetical protein
MLFRVRLSTILFCLAALCGIACAQSQDAAAWRVSKASGSVWVVSAGVQPASLTDQAQVKPGDSIRTGSNGRVLLERGTETILIAPNSVLTIPATQKDATSTTIQQQSGSIRLQVDKRNVRSFEVETPYLVAAVKGTQFTVTVNKNDASVQVFGGSVEVSDFKTGDVALVAPGQSATVSTQPNGGLSLSGAGILAPIQHGTPRPSPVAPLTVPRNGLSAPADVPVERHVRALGPHGPAHGDVPATHHVHLEHRGGPLHIGAPLGELRLDIHRVTHGLARGNDTASVQGTKQSTFWSSGDVTPGNGVSKAYNQGNNGSGSGAGTATGAGNGSAGGAASAGGNGNGNGNANGQGNSNGNGQGNVNANGNGANNTNGNGNKNGHHKS